MYFQSKGYVNWALNWKLYSKSDFLTPWGSHIWLKSSHFMIKQKLLHIT